MKLSKTERRQRDITDLANSTGELNVGELARRFDVSESTIRRDLASLEKESKVIRTYGGVLPPADNRETPMSLRMRERADEKQKIASYATRFLVNDQTIYLDSGSTTTMLAHELKQMDIQLTVVTSSLSILQILATLNHVNVILTGGTWRPITEGFVGPWAEKLLQSFTFDLVFLGADAVHADFGLCEASADQVHLKDFVATRGKEVYVLVDEEKLNKQPFNTWAPFGSGWHVLTNHATTDIQESFRRAGVALIRVDQTTD